MSLIWQALRSKKALAAGAVLMSSVTLAAVVDNVGRQIDVIYRAWASGKPSPVISHTMATFTLDDAYAIQHGYVDLRLKKDSVRGFKGGMTTPQAHKAVRHGTTRGRRAAGQRRDIGKQRKVSGGQFR